MRISPLTRIIASIALLSFGALLLFWWIGPHVGPNHLCASASIQHQVCPDSTTMSATLFHLKTTLSLSSFIVQTIQLLGLLALVVLLILQRDRFSIGPLHRFRLFAPNTASPSPPERYRRWLSLFEHSPSMV